MLGIMQDRPMLISTLIDYAAQYHGEGEIVSRTVEGPIHRYTYTDAQKRSKQLAKALLKLDVKLGDRVATLAWNGFRHFELYYGVSGLGAVLHTINPRLFAEQIIYIVNHAEDDYIFTDLTFVPLLEQVQDQFEGVKGFVIMTDEANMPETTLNNVLCYETLIDAEDDEFEWPTFDENTASSLCYTSGTTGNPKGVLYSHRSTVIHSFIVCMKDTLGLSSMETVLPVVPMFHANCWGIAYAAPMCGAKLVFPGAGMDGASVYELLNYEKVTMTAGVPTVWLMLLNHMRENKLTLDTVSRVVCGGSAAPRAMIEEFEEAHGAVLIHAWGMTEMSPIGTCGTLKTGMENYSPKERYDVQEKQGRGIYGVEMKIIDDDNEEQPRDGVAFGRLMVRGPAICSGYFKGDGGDVLDDDGWFDTGDVANISPQGYMQIVDRSKDVIKTGGEWISSIDLENTAVGHPDVVEACVIGVYHPKWDERPLMLIIKSAGSDLDREGVLAYLEDKIVKWWTPDDVVFVDELPHTATGKLLKSKLREEYKDYKLPTA